MIAIHASLHKSMETTFYETLKNYIDTMMPDDHGPIEALIYMLLYSMSNATDLISLKESQLMLALVVDFLVASAD